MFTGNTPGGSYLKVYVEGYETTQYCMYKIGSTSLQSAGNIIMSVQQLASPQYSGQIPDIGNINPLLRVTTNAQHEGAPGAACFVGDTLITTPTGVKEIKDIVDGDKIVTTFWNTETKKKSNSFGIVSEKISHKDNPVITVTHTGKSKEFTCTPDHFIFMPDGQFKEISSFEVGDELVDSVNKCNVTIISITEAPNQDTYNFAVTPHKNYIANDILVHNSGGSKVDAIPGPYNLNLGDTLVYTEDSQ